MESETEDLRERCPSLSLTAVYRRMAGGGRIEKGEKTGQALELDLFRSHIPFIISSNLLYRRVNTEYKFSYSLRKY